MAEPCLLLAICVCFPFTSPRREALAIVVHDRPQEEGWSSSLFADSQNVCSNLTSHITAPNLAEIALRAPMVCLSSLSNFQVQIFLRGHAFLTELARLKR